MREGSDKQLMYTKVDKQGLIRKGKLSKLLNMQSFGHNITGASNQKTVLTKVVKEYALIQEMSWRPLTMDSFGHKMFI